MPSFSATVCSAAVSFVADLGEHNAPHGGGTRGVTGRLCQDSILS